MIKFEAGKTYRYEGNEWYCMHVADGAVYLVSSERIGHVRWFYAANQIEAAWREVKPRTKVKRWAVLYCDGTISYFLNKQTKENNWYFANRVKAQKEIEIVFEEGEGL